jgi:hypothetical protein
MTETQGLYAAVEWRVMPHPRLAQNKKALRIPRAMIRNKGVLRTLEYLSNRDALAMLLKNARSRAGRPPLPARTLLRAHISIWRTGSGYPDADADNLAKTVLDAVKEAGWIEDDRWVRSPYVDVFDDSPKDVVAIRMEVRDPMNPYGWTS